jgi:hypothetical protein
MQALFESNFNWNDNSIVSYDWRNRHNL